MYIYEVFRETEIRVIPKLNKASGPQLKQNYTEAVKLARL